MSAIEKLKGDADRFSELTYRLKLDLEEAVSISMYAVEILDQLIDTIHDVDPARLEAYYKAQRITNPIAFTRQIGWLHDPESAADFVEHVVALADRERQRFDKRERRRLKTASKESGSRSD
jgi:hypothetical protein